MGEHGKFDIFFYPLGKEEYTDKVIPGFTSKPGDFDGIIIVLIKMEFDFPTKDSAKIQDFLSKIDSKNFLRFDNKFEIRSSQEI